MTKNEILARIADILCSSAKLNAPAEAWQRSKPQVKYSFDHVRKLHRWLVTVGDYHANLGVSTERFRMMYPQGRQFAGLIQQQLNHIRRGVPGWVAYGTHERLQEAECALDEALACLS